MSEHKALSRRRVTRLLTPVAAAVLVATGALAAPARAANATVGYACAFYTNVSLFGGPYGSEGCGTQTSTYASANSAAPSVTLPASGVLTSLADADGATAQYGPAKIISSPYDTADNTRNTGVLKVSTSGGTTVSSTAIAKSVGPSPFWTANPTSWVPPGRTAVTTEGLVKANCTATATAKTFSVTVKNGYVDTKTDANGFPTNTVVVPLNPPVNYQIPFTIDNVGDHGVMVFNERITNPDGSKTLNASHMYMQGPTALGDAIIGQVTCGHA